MIVKSLPAGSANGVTLRQSTTVNTFYMFRFAQATGNYELYKFIAAVSTLLASYTPTPAVAAGDVHSLRITARGSLIAGLVDGAQVVSATDTAITAAGRAGIRTTAVASPGDTVGIHLDNFKLIDTAPDAGGGRLKKRARKQVLKTLLTLRSRRDGHQLHLLPRIHSQP